MFEYIKKYKIENFAEFQDKVLIAIDMIKDEHECLYAKMSHSDYKVDAKPLYHDLVMKAIEPMLLDYIQQWRCDDWEMQNVWFAEYHDGADFDYHCHEGCNMSGVIQLVLDNPKYGTTIMNHKTDLEEGDVIMFPAMLPHKSPYVEEGSKIVVGFNWNMVGSTASSSLRGDV